MNFRYYLTIKSTFQSEKPKKLEKTSLNDKFFDWDYLHFTALMKEAYFNRKTKLANQRSLSVLSIPSNLMSSLPVKTAAGPEATHHGKLFNDPHMPLKEKREHIKWSDNWEHLKPDWLYRHTKP